MNAYRFSSTVGAACILFIATHVLYSADLSKAKCPVSGRAVDEEYSVKFGGGKVYFCSDNCLPQFTHNPTPYTVKANHQLVVTGQAKQEKCPLTGKPVDATKKVEIDGVSVGFCCEKCQDKISKETQDQQMQECFGPEAFLKAFKVHQ